MEFWENRVTADDVIHHCNIIPDSKFHNGCIARCPSR